LREQAADHQDDDDVRNRAVFEGIGSVFEQGVLDQLGGALGQQDAAASKTPRQSSKADDPQHLIVLRLRLGTAPPDSLFTLRVVVTAPLHGAPPAALQAVPVVVD